MKQVEIAVIVNSYNRLDLLKRSMDGLLRELSKTELVYSVIIFEAGSKDGSLEWLENLAQDPANSIHVLQPDLKEETSFSYGVNKAVNYAIDQYKSLTYLFLYETDNYLHSSLPIIQSKDLLADMQDVAACGYTVVKHDGTNAGFGSAFPSFISFLLGQQLSFFLRLNVQKIHWIKKNNFKYSYTDIAYTSPLLIKKDAWQKVNGFDADNFPFSDCDIDLAYRLKLHGLKMAVISTQQVVHDNLEIKSSWSEYRTLNYYRARFVYFKKHYGGVVQLAKPFLWLMHFGELILISMMVLFGKRDAKSLKSRQVLLKTVFEEYQIKKNDQ